MLMPIIVAATVIAFVLFWHLIAYFREIAVHNHSMNLAEKRSEDMMKKMFRDDETDDMEALLKVVQ